MSRPKIKDKKKAISLSINIELDKILDSIVKEKNISKSQYIEYLIKKELEKMENEFEIWWENGSVDGVIKINPQKSGNINFWMICAYGECVQSNYLDTHKIMGHVLWTKLKDKGII